METQNRQYSGMSFDYLYQNDMRHATRPQFTDSLAHAFLGSNWPVYLTASMGSNHDDIAGPTAISMPYSVSGPPLIASTKYTPAGYGASTMLNMQYDIPRSTFDSFTLVNYPSKGYASGLAHQQDARHMSYPGDTLFDASCGMVALSQDLTPRNIYDPRRSRGTADSYGFPSTHSSVSSTSTASNYPYYSSSVASVSSSITDYSSTLQPSDGLSLRTLSRSNSLLGPAGAALQSMMGQFRLKMPSNTQKNHKCKVCDMRFTRPSSLQTHMYSHTGEKPYACDVEGCGNHFSVVSNLRRHKRLHKVL